MFIAGSEGGIVSVDKKKLKKADIIPNMEVLAKWSANGEYYAGRIMKISDQKIVLPTRDYMAKDSATMDKDARVLFLSFFLFSFLFFLLLFLSFSSFFSFLLLSLIASLVVTFSFFSFLVEGRGSWC